MRAIFLKYTIGITGAILSLLVLHLNFGTDVAALPVSIAFYGWLAYLLLRWCYRNLRSCQKFKSLWMPDKKD